VRLADTDWTALEDFRIHFAASQYAHVVEGAQAFVSGFAARFPSVALARLFIVMPFERLPPFDQRSAKRLVEGDRELRQDTPVLSLLGSAGHKPAFLGRLESRGHLAIPLLDRAFVQSIPMVTQLLVDLDVDLEALDEGRPIVTRRMLGGHNAAFYVADARTARDERGRAIIPAQDFVEAHGIATVFGMGGAYVDGTLVAAVLFCQEHLDKLRVERFQSFISTFKMATAQLLQAGKIYPSS
jgi:hypothetical protein